MPATLVTSLFALFTPMIYGDSWAPLWRFIIMIAVLGGIATFIGWFLGPLALTITSAGGVAGTAIRQLGHRRG